MESDLNGVAFSVQERHSAVILANGTVKTWGYGVFGRLGHGNTLNQLRPKTVDGITDAVSVACGLFPVNVVDLLDVIAISAGVFHSIALRSDGRILSWGINQYGQLGRTPTTNSPNTRPGLVPDLINVVTISTGSSYNIVVRSDGSVASWGHGANGRLGNGGTANSYQSIQNCGSFSSAVNVSAGDAHSLILLERGDLWATGWNGNGQLGIGDTTQQTSPVRIDGFKFAVVAAGAHSNIGVLTNGIVVVWGRNDWSQLGDGTTTDGNRPFVLEQLSGVYAMSIWHHALVACNNGTVFGWGHNQYGKIGDGTTQTRSTAVPITDLEV
ncbi:hypothetical protein RCL1_006143 [Eukaryota sp. TZLM3-RCL]